MVIRRTGRACCPVRKNDTLYGRPLWSNRLRQSYNCQTRHSERHVMGTRGNKMAISRSRSFERKTCPDVSIERRFTRLLAVAACCLLAVFGPWLGLARSAPAENSVWFLAEGCTDYGFETDFFCTNPNNSEVTVKTTFMMTDGTTQNFSEPFPAHTTYDLNPADVIGARSFSTKIECLEGKQIAVERLMSWSQNPPGEMGEAHSSIGVNAPSNIWYLPEGSSKWGFECWLLVQNPNPVPATVLLTYMIEGSGPQTVTKSVGPNSRSNFFMADDIGLADASIKVESNVKVIAERAMYRNGRREGHGSIGTTAPATDYYLAEGTTGYGFTTYVLIQNPNNATNVVNVTYDTNAGPVTQPAFTMQANSRKTIRVNDVLPGKDMSTHVHGSLPLIAERAMYWDSGYGETCHDSIGLSQPHKYFYLPAGISSPFDPQTGNAGYETFTLVQNPNDVSVKVILHYVDYDQAQEVILAPNSRRTFNMADVFGSNTAMSGISVVSETPGKNIMVEKANYMVQRTFGTDTIGAYSDVSLAGAGMPERGAGAGNSSPRDRIFKKFLPGRGGSAAQEVQADGRWWH